MKLSTVGKHVESVFHEIHTNQNKSYGLDWIGRVLDQPFIEQSFVIEQTIHLRRGNEKGKDTRASCELIGGLQRSPSANEFLPFFLRPKERSSIPNGPA